MPFRWLRRLMLTAACAFTLLAGTPVGWWLSAPLRVTAKPERADAIVLLSSGQLDDDYLSTDAAQRLLGALDLYRRGFASVIVSSGVTPNWAQAETQAGWLRRMGVPAAAIVTENQSTRTYTSVLAIRALMLANGWHRVVFVTSALDVPRLRAVSRRAGVDASYLAVPTEPGPGGPLYLHYGAGVLWHAAYEYAGLAYYWWHGWL